MENLQQNNQQQTYPTHCARLELNHLPFATRFSHTTPLPVIVVVVVVVLVLFTKLFSVSY